MGEEQIIFYFFAASVLISALCVVVMKNLVRSIFLFFVTLFSLAALYLFALADFIALAQIVIYAGGVLVLMLFAFMLSNRELLNSLKPTNSGFKVNNFAGILISLLFLLILALVIIKTDLNQLVWIQESVPVNPADNTTHQIGIYTMTTYLLPFEILSVFLMMALIGAAHLARKGGKA
ncbi:MAG TPA: NADH-quinone oxidoreductase subunit J [Daejeonella sp.]|uniref:NADH-quinone oxidoreductase subunit J family protein n=1 Tax=Daejeonella sp. TaxID=2805397 RepID=UPI002ED972D7